LVLGALPYWERLRRLKSAQAALMGTNAAVVGLLLAAFYDPIWTVAVTDSSRLAFALVAFGLLRFAAVPPWLLVLLSAGAGHLLF
jgi:chromate transporter